MRILLTNDDGVYAKGIETLYLALIEEHDVTVVAPETEQSAVGHAITWLDPLRVKPVHRNGHFFGHALTGTPADCVKIAVAELMSPPPDMVVSGVNMGANVGVNVIYSGTVSAATEAAVMGIPSMAVSIDSFQPTDFSAVTEFVPRLLRIVAKEGLPPGVCLNVNVPNLPADRIRGVKVTRQGHMKMVERYDRRIDPRGHVYYWLTNSALLRDDDPATDSLALARDYISVTPIHHDLTHYEMIDTLGKWNL
ncbi:5'/3'-nucleotidase SurE [Syntrophobacter fumaroxidans]|uniref:5'-nucleotidase SurE n=1 Tax=Syntrophobacter fumaroxidans (strain DSM 10017 / MPOB) TaxID=335543 RepID=SURE_SYNFM|nr:5'/3'-nucleotidase SurE [Syntrophobacter fumaroxidans]A0LHG0.1 RecName: Full=5'-nucleotidase SurE; AltName: Full=Nucleoside 5'-monophosphate phosphohydrolase [Syntrophobacter fumaroxidans MPOB]ABK16862.1 5'-nucleotidase / exopolyphosphatase / 3'-nucleotidase [Syntrophobacter fumaroxidans MPOB]